MEGDRVVDLLPDGAARVAVGGREGLVRAERTAAVSYRAVAVGAGETSVDRKFLYRPAEGAAAVGRIAVIGSCVAPGVHVRVENRFFVLSFGAVIRGPLPVSTAVVFPGIAFSTVRTLWRVSRGNAGIRSEVPVACVVGVLRSVGNVHEEFVSGLRFEIGDAHEDAFRVELSGFRHGVLRVGLVLDKQGDALQLRCV